MRPKDIERIYRTAVPEDLPPSYKLTWDTSTLELVKSRIRLRYGTNPNQRAAFYVPKDSLWEHAREVKTGKEGLSQTNVSDIDRALRILRYFDKPACAVMKHLIPSGFASVREDLNLETVYVRARDCDPVAAFGGVVVFNRSLDRETATEIGTTFVEVVAAPGFDSEAVKIFEKKVNLRVVEYSLSDLAKTCKFAGDAVTNTDLEFSTLLDGSFIISDPFLTSIRSRGDIQVVTKSTPTGREYEDLIFSWYVGIGVRSNGIVVSKDGGTLGIGAGQQDRVTAVRLALEKAALRGHKQKLKGSVLASDGFFPFRDSIDIAADYGVSAIIQPGGSMRDQEVVDACNEHGIAMAFTGERTFGHF